MSSTRTFWILGAVLAIPAALISYSLERRRRKHHPERHPYQWGFFVSLDVFFLGAFVLLNAFTDLITGRYGVGAWKFFFGAVYLVVGRLGARWTRTGLVASTILTLNPLVWLVGIFYLRKRWKELGDPNAVTTSDGRRRERVYRNMY